MAESGSGKRGVELGLWSGADVRLAGGCGQDIILLTLDLDGPFFSKVKDNPRWHAYLVSVGQAPEQLATIEFNPPLPPEIELRREW